MKKFFQLFDADNDGEITNKDLELIADRCIKAGHLEGEQATATKEKFNWVYKDFISSDSDPTTFDKYLAMLKKAGKEEIRKAVHIFFPLFFNIIDTDQDGFISPKEFLVFSSFYAITKEDSKKSFEMIDTNKDGKISKEEFEDVAEKFCLLEAEGDPSEYFLGPLP